jgi:hypothetical protein
MIVETAAARTGEDRRWTVSSTVHAGDARHDVWYRGAGELPGSFADMSVAAALIPSMRSGTDLQIPGGVVSARLLRSAPALQDIVHGWDTRFTPVAIRAAAGTSRDSTPKKGVGCFFTAGVDSFYTLLAHREEITHLIFVHGFDVPLANGPVRSQVAAAIRAIAAAMDKRLIEVETNLRDFSDRYARWDLHYHGAALASVAHLLAGTLSKAYIAASYAYSGLFPWGSHPSLDPLWSGDDLELVHHGCDTTRLQKVLTIAACDSAVRFLRVCYENRDGRYNCGACQKCLRTMASLRLAGVLDRCGTFPAALDVRAVAQARVPEQAWPFLRENLEAAETWGNDPALATALRKSLHASGVKRRWLR